MATINRTTPSAQLREMAAWLAAHADEIVPHGGDAILEDGVDLCITLHIRDPHEYAPTVSVSGRTEFIAREVHRASRGGNLTMAINLDDYMRYGPMTLNPVDGLCMKMPIECDIDSMAKDLAREIDEAALPRTLEILETQYGYVKAERLQDLQAENKKLREENQSIGLIAYELGRNSMADENKKLRELLTELYESAWLEYPSAFEHTFAERLRELGVKV